MNPKKMKGMLKSMGINIEEIDGVEEVIIRTADREIVLQNASVAVMDAQGNRTYQVSGDAIERQREPNALVIPEEDVMLVASQTGAGIDAARAALQSTGGDLAEAIVRLGAK